jgi:hypothetical protein
MSAKRALSRVRAPEERLAGERAWVVVRSAYADRPFVAVRTSRWRLALIPALVALVAGVALSPAGATISRLIRHALGVPHAAHALFSLPAPGRLLVSGPGGTWTVGTDGSSRRLGTFAQASWSPHGLYIAATHGDQLAVIDPHGVIRWTLARPKVSDPTWYSPSGYRMAYLSGRQLRVVAGDGTGDHLLANDVAPVTPAWRSDHPYQLAYLESSGALVVRDADTGRLIWTARIGSAGMLGWSANGGRLLVLARTRALIYTGDGRLVGQIAGGGHSALLSGSLSPDGRTLALVRSGAAPAAAVASVQRRGSTPRPVLSGEGLRQAVWAPNGRWLLVSWPTADQWVFIRVAGAPGIIGVSRIAQQFAGGSTRRGFPEVDGWCCTAP